jgi:4-hydroxy-tetrahydrodipicolinate reductase
MNKKSKLKIIVAGAKGRMGSLIVNLARASGDIIVTGEAEQDSPLEKVIEKGDVVIDFTVHDAAVQNAKTALEHRKPIVIGTTGLTAKEEDFVRKASQRIAVVYAPNMSIGVNVMWKLVEKAARVLVPKFHVDILEEHHVHKKDRPSGTAKKILDLVLAGGGLRAEEDVLVYEENAPEGAQKPVSVGSVRKGEIVGNHTVRFVTQNEEVEIIHRAFNRNIFAEGALTAARWVADKKPGLYTMFDVLDI